MLSVKRFFTAKPIIALELAVFVFLGANIGKEVLKRKAIDNEIQALHAEINQLEEKKTTLAALLEYTKTDSFVEHEARTSLNLAKPGEQVVVIPEVDAETAKGAVLGDAVSAEEEVVVVKEPSNITLWWSYFFEAGE